MQRLAVVTLVNISNSVFVTGLSLLTEVWETDQIIYFENDLWW